MSTLSLGRSASKMPRSAIRDVMDSAWAVEAQLGPDERLLHLEVGQPTFETPRPIIEAMERALREPKFQRYIQNAGLPELREAVAHDYQTRHPASGSRINPEGVVVCHGAVGAVSTLIQALVEPGDEVLVPDPAWVNYGMATTLRGGVPVPYGLGIERGWRPLAADIEGKITDKTRIIVVCSPSNPTGAVLSRDELGEIAQVAARRGVLVLSDEVYGQIYFGGQEEGERAPSLFDCPGVDPEFAAVVSGVSKAYSMTGFRVGWIATANPALARVCANLQEASISCGVPVAQVGAIAALTSPQVEADVASMVEQYRSRRDAALDVLGAYGVREYTPSGAFYLLVRFAADGAAGPQDAVEFCKASMRDNLVAASPGSAFGVLANSYVRVSLASEVADIETGVDGLCKQARAAGFLH